MSAAPEKPVSQMSAQEFERAVRNRDWRAKPEPQRIFTPEEVALRRKIVLNLPPEQFAVAVKMRAWKV